MKLVLSLLSPTAMNASLVTQAAVHVKARVRLTACNAPLASTSMKVAASRHVLAALSETLIWPSVIIAILGVLCVQVLGIPSARRVRRVTPFLKALAMRLFVSTLNSRILSRFTASLVTHLVISAVVLQVRSARFVNFLRSSLMGFARSATSTMDTL